MSIEAARLKRARRRMRGYFLGSGVVLAILYLIAAAFVVKLFGVELSRYWWTLMLGACVMLAGTYALVMFIWLGANLTLRWKRGQPLMEIED
jgi:hypothetical protein